MHAQSPLSDHFRLTKNHTAVLERLGIRTVEDLLRYYPTRYEQLGARTPIAHIPQGEIVTVYGALSAPTKRLSWKTKRYIVEATLTDETGSIPVQWFNQPYAEGMFKNAHSVRVTGKVTGTTKPYFANPTVETLPELPDALLNNTSEGLFPVYAESGFLSGKWFYHAIKKVLETLDPETLEDPVPLHIRKRYNLPELSKTLSYIHAPQDERHASAARKRVAFDEVFFIQLAKARDRAFIESQSALAVVPHAERIESFIRRFPFELTRGQKKAIDTICADLSKSTPMSRLLEGDVGSGKTAVAASVAYAVTDPASKKPSERLQVAYMTPTEILAQQQFESFIAYFRHDPTPIGLITSSGCKKFPSKVHPDGATDISRTQFLKWVANGEIPIVVGTHSLVQESVKFARLACVIIDEQHRFGVRQRKALARKQSTFPHLLSMTATPIPRTLTLTVYGDLDLSLLDELPKNRATVETSIIAKKDRDAVYVSMRQALTVGRQAFVICPRIDEPDPKKALTLRAKSVTEEKKRLEAGPLIGFRLATLHGKMKPKEKEDIMRAFAEHHYDVLVTTSVVEVGVNVPNATEMIIEGAERFGLSQLHQLRGRVSRSEHKGHCYLFAESTSPKTKERLSLFAKAKNGFELAEADLLLRGAGELGGGKQWGVSDIGMEALKNIKMVEAARESAKELIAQDPELSDFPALHHIVEHKATETHFE